MIIRMWHGWTTPENADVYEELLMTEIFPGIGLLRCDIGYEVEFVTQAPKMRC